MHDVQEEEEDSPVEEVIQKKPVKPVPKKVIKNPPAPKKVVQKKECTVFSF